MQRIQKPLAALAASRPAIFEPRQAVLVKRNGPRAIAQFANQIFLQDGEHQKESGRE
jgi:hypothetical protein